MSLANADLYQELEVRRLAGRLTLVTPPDVAVEVIGANIDKLAIDADEVTLTGAMSIWAYLVVFHCLHGRTRRVWYEDGLGNRVLVMAHG